MLVDLVVAVSADVLKSKGISVPSIAGTILKGVMQRRVATAREVLLSEIASGEKLPAQAANEDEVISILHRYFAAAYAGAARQNLRLMAKMVRGKAATPQLYASEFLRYAAIIESLSYEEILILSVSYRLMKEGQCRGNEIYQAGKELEGKGLMKPGRFYLLTQALQRTGFIVHSSVGGNPISSATEFLQEFGALSEIEAICPEDLQIQ